MRPKSSKQKILLLILLNFTLTIFFACKKQGRESEKSENTNATKYVNKESLNGYTDFLKIPGLDSKIKNSVITTYYKYFSKKKNQLWIMALKPDTYGFPKAKIAASLKNDRFSMIIVSYNYDSVLYKKEISALILA